MRILMISPVGPYPANTGGLVRITKLFEGLSRFHEVALAIPQKAGESNTHHLPENGTIIALPSESSHPLKPLTSVLACWPYHASIYYSEAMNRGVRELVQSGHYSFVYCHFIYTLPYVKGAGIPVVLDHQNVDRQYWTRKAAHHRRHGDVAKYWFSRINLWKTVRFENVMLQHVSSVVSVAEDDAAETRKFAPDSVTHFLVAPNGVDTTHFVPKLLSREKLRGELVIGFLGSLDLELNQRAAFTVCKEILPCVQSSLPDVIVSALIIGRNPPEELVQYARDNPATRITVTGTVEDVLPYLHRVDVLALPLESGAGTKLRVLEAMSAGVCVVGSPLALMGIEGLVAGENAFLARSVEEFEVTICRLVRDPEQRRRVALCARNLVERQFSWDLITSKLSDQLEDLYSRS